MSVPPPSSAPPGTTVREHVVELEPSRSWGVRRTGELRLGPLGVSIQYDRLLEAPLRLPLSMLQLGLIDRGPAAVTGDSGRFAVLRRLSPTAVVPREHGIEGWLWTSVTGSALTLIGDEEMAPNAALLFTKPLGEEVVEAAFSPAATAEIGARSPLGTPAVLGVLLRVVDTILVEQAFRLYGLLRPLTDRDVPPTMRRSLPTDIPASPLIAGGQDVHASTSVAPPGMG